jgi:hypothetical protein
MKRINQLTTDEKRMLLCSLETGEVKREDLSGNLFIESDIAEAFKAMIKAAERVKKGEKIKLMLIGEAEKLGNTKLPAVAMELIEHA